MAITKAQANSSREFHYPNARPCDDKRGPIRLRRNGKTQFWVRQPERFRIPTKFGLRDHVQITNDNADLFHAIEDCPVGVTGDYRNHAIGCLAQYEHPGSCTDAERTTVWQ